MWLGGFEKGQKNHYQTDMIPNGTYERRYYGIATQIFFESDKSSKKMNNYMMAASGGTPRKSENSDDEKKYKKKGTLKSIS